MRSFTLSALATLAFGIFCSAAPTPGGLPAVAVAARDTPAPVEADQTLQYVFATASDSLSPLVAQVADLNTVGAVDGAIQDVVIPLLGDVVDILQCLLAGIAKLQGLPVQQTLINIETGVELDVAGIVETVLPVVKGVLTILVGIIRLVGGTVTGSVLPLVLSVVGFLVQVLTAVLGLIGILADDVIAFLAEEIGDLVTFLPSLGAYDLLNLLHISY